MKNSCVIYSRSDRKRILKYLGGVVYAQGRCLSIHVSFFDDLLINIRILTGAGMHPAAIMAKHNLENLIDANPNITSQYPDFNGSFDYMRTYKLGIN